MRNLLQGAPFYEKLGLVVWRMVLFVCLCQLAHVGRAAHVRVLLEQAGTQLSVNMTGSHRGYVDIDARQIASAIRHSNDVSHTNSPSNDVNPTRLANLYQHHPRSSQRPTADAYLATSLVNPSPRFETAFSLTWQVQAHAGYLYSETARLGRTLTLVSDSGVVRYRGQAYRGSLHLVATFEGILVINVLPLEDYLRGVVAEEMFANWPHEALKAQAIAARSYAFHTLDPHAPFDICATFECQQYGGIDGEHPRSDAAIAATQGIVVTYNGDIARTYYHADSGGYTASSAEVWGEAASYLVGTPDTATNSPHRRWQHTVNATQVATSLERYGYNIGTLRGLRILETSPSGRVSKLEVIADRSVELAGPQLHSLLREWGFKSTRFTMTSALSALGDGWGHGVGMSQYGAKALAENDYTYQQILAFYYPNTQLHVLADSIPYTTATAANIPSDTTH